MFDLGFFLIKIKTPTSTTMPDGRTLRACSNMQQARSPGLYLVLFMQIFNIHHLFS